MLPENKLFAAALVIVALVAAAAVLENTTRETGESASSSYVIESTTLTRISVATTSTTVWDETTSSSAATTSLGSTTVFLASTSTIPETTTTTLPWYAGRGYRKATMKIAFFCPSCVPAVVRNLHDTPGVVTTNIAYRNKLDYVVYDPKKVEVETILQLVTGNGDGELVSDEEV